MLAGVLFVIGLLRVSYFERARAIVFHSHAFPTKFSLLIIVGLLLIIWAANFLLSRDAMKVRQVPEIDAMERVTMVIHAERAAIVVILPCAAIMARAAWV